jgi:sporulation protein YlmC with PRC-barrel domain
MDLALNAAVRCSDGSGGQITRIILNPLTKKVTDIVVRGPSRLGAERLVPVEEIVTATPEEVTLQLTRKALSRMQRFITHEFVPQQDTSMSGGAAATFYWPYSIPARDTLDVTHPAIPPEELAVRRSDRVEAIDGQIGHVDALLIDPQTEAITHLILREGHLWGRRELTIPISQIVAIEDGVVRLGVDKATVETQPAIPTHGYQAEEPQPRVADAAAAGHQ